MKKNILSMAALLMASATVFTACSNDDDIIGEHGIAGIQPCPSCQDDCRLHGLIQNIYVP